ncbi:hypothetical protein HMSSN036_87350 [Paenibacillus macerans]|nr:hypothetical protein HMSSN036_87350 [Paenibacillus macerans]
MNKFWKGLAISGLALSVVSAGSFVKAKGEQPEQNAANGKSRNLIVLIGDGMGPAQISAARYYQQYEHGVKSLNLDPYYVGQATTYADRGGRRGHRRVRDRHGFGFGRNRFRHWTQDV